MTADNDYAEQNATGQHQDEVAEKFARMRRPLVKGEPRRHHFVPKVYLRRFAENDQLIRVLLSEPTKRGRVNIDNLCVITNLYTAIDDEVGESVAVEHFLGDLDNNVKQPLDILTLGVLLPLTPKLKFDLAIWISFLWVRGPDTRRTMEAIFDYTTKLQLSSITDEKTAKHHLHRIDGSEADSETVQALLNSVENMNSLEITPHQNILIDTMLEAAKEIIPHILNRKLTVIKYPTPGLVISDKPLVLYQSEHKWSPDRGVGIGSADEIWLPLDRSTLLVLHSDDQIDEHQVRVETSDNLAEINQVIVSQALSEVFCHPDDIARVDEIHLRADDQPILNVSGPEWFKGKTDGVNQRPRRRRPIRYRRPESQ